MEDFRCPWKARLERYHQIELENCRIKSQYREQITDDPNCSSKKVQLPTWANSWQTFYPFLASQSQKATPCLVHCNCSSCKNAVRGYPSDWLAIPIQNQTKEIHPPRTRHLNTEGDLYVNPYLHSRGMKIWGGGTHRPFFDIFSGCPWNPICSDILSLYECPLAYVCTRIRHAKD